MSAASPGRRALLLCLLLPAWALAQPCRRAAEVTAPDLLGLWRAEFEGLPPATLLLEKHPEYADSFRGRINRGGVQGFLAGELEDAELVLEESADGQRIAATWVGEIVDGSCGREIRGVWKRDGETREYPFVLRRA